jgi:hypothetical protein
VSSNRTVSDVGNQIKMLFEGRQWPALGELLKEAAQLWYVYQPISVPEAMAMAEETLRGAEDIELTLLRIVRTESTEAHSRGSYQCRLGWFEPAGLKQQEVSFDVHLGFQLKPEVKLEFLGVTEASPEPELPSEETEKEAAAPAPAPAALPAGAVPFIAGAVPAVEGSEAPVMVYVPLLVPASAVQAHLRKWLGS